MAIPTRLLDRAITEHAMHLRDPTTATDASQRSMQRDLKGHRRQEMKKTSAIRSRKSRRQVRR